MPHVQLFIPCFVDQLYPETAMNMVKILEKLGCEVAYNTKQTCCGQPAWNAGYQADAKAVATKFLHDFDNDTYIVTPGGSCAGYVRSSFSPMFINSSLHNLAGRVQRNMLEFTEFLVDILKVEDIGASLPGKATYHDACGALRECGIKAQPRKLLQHVKDLELIEMQECETCCGFGGTFAVKYEAISVGMAQVKVKSALDAGAKYLVTTDASCMMHLQAYIDKNEIDLQTMHIADVLASGW
jgi:L-lactate dehydrogenase complex protein LldE